jgi:hypothetical protein
MESATRIQLSDERMLHSKRVTVRQLVQQEWLPQREPGRQRTVATLPVFSASGLLHRLEQIGTDVQEAGRIWAAREPQSGDELILNALSDRESALP